MKQSIIEVNNIAAEDLFSWCFDSVIGHGGDGTAAICCDNYQEAFEMFKKWAIDNNAEYLTTTCKAQKLEDTIILHDNNENYIFTKDCNLNLFEGDYVFIVRGDCPSWNSNNPVIKSIKGNKNG